MRWGYVVAFAVSVVVGLVAVVCLSFWLWPKLADPTTAGAATALAGIIAAGAGGLSAVAGAVAAFAAFSAARESRRIGRDASEALGLAMKPTLKIDRTQLVSPTFTGEVIRIENPSSWAAADIAVDYNLDDGRTGHAEFDRLPAKPPFDPNVGDQLSQVQIQLPARVTQPWDDHAWLGDVQLVNTVVLKFSDERRLLRWRTTLRRQHWVKSDGKTRSESEGSSLVTERER